MNFLKLKNRNRDKKIRQIEELIKLGVDEQHKSNYKKAIRYLENAESKAFELYNVNKSTLGDDFILAILNLLFRISLMNEDLNSAESQIQKMEIISSSHLITLISKAEIGVLKENYAESLEILEKINVKSDGNLSFLKGVCLANLEGYEEALDMFLLANSFSDDSNIKYNIAQTYIQLENVEEALKYYLQTIELDPDNKEAFYGASYCYSQLGDTANSEKYSQ